MIKNFDSAKQLSKERKYRNLGASFWLKSLFCLMDSKFILKLDLAAHKTTNALTLI